MGMIFLPPAQVVLHQRVVLLSGVSRSVEIRQVVVELRESHVGECEFWHGEVVKLEFCKLPAASRSCKACKQC